MSHPLIPFLVVAAWFLACGLVLAPLSRAYVLALLFVASFAPFTKFLLAGALWIAFALIAVLPLYVGIGPLKAFLSAQLDWPYIVWTCVCYGASCVPVYKAINGKHLPKLQSAGFFKE